MSWFDDEFSDHPQTPADIIRDAYRKYLGRDPSYQEINSQTGNGSFGLNDPRLQMSVNNIAQSPEAVQYGLAHPQGTGGGGSNSGGGDGLSFDDLMGKLRQAYPSGTNADFAQAQKDHPDWFTGWTVTGSKGDKLTKDGRTYDMIIASGEGGKGWNGSDVTDGGGDSVSHTFDYPDWTDTFTYQDFQAPTGLTEENDPGFQARLKLGTDALQRAAAAKGSVLTGGTLKDLNSYAQDFASNEFQNVYNREANTYLTNRNNAASNYNQRYQQYLNGFNQALSAFGANNTVDQQLWQRAFNENQAGFANMVTLADLGLSGANGTAGSAGQYGNNASGLITGIGNANAAGQVGGANAWNGSLGTLANLGLGYLYNSFYNNRSPYGENSTNYPTNDTWGWG